jgi:hypothetical protein
MATVIDPRTGREFETDPDEVKPEDLVTAPTPLPITPGGAALAFINPQTLPGTVVNTIAARQQSVQDARQQAVLDEAANAPAEAPAVPAAPPPVAKPLKQPTGGGGGGGGAAPESALRKDLARVSGEEEAQARQQGKFNEQRAEKAVQKAEDDARIAEQHQLRQAAIQQETDAEIVRRQGVVDEETAKYKSMGFKDFWSQATILGKPNTVTGARVLGAISIALGAAGAALTKGPNYALEIIDRAIERDYQRQRDSIMKQKEAVTEARFGVEAARQARADKLISLENWRKGAYEQAEKLAASEIAKLGVEPDKSQQALMAGVHARALESKMAVEKGIAQIANTRADTALKRAEAERTRTSAAGEKQRPLTEGQGKAADLAGRMLQDSKIIDETGPISPEGQQRLRRLAAMEAAMANQPKVRAALVASGTLKTPEQLLNERDQLAYGARRRFAASVLRGDSGAAISAGEYLSFDEQNFEQIGEKPASAKAKKIARDQQVQGKLRAAGQAASDVVRSVQATPSVLPSGGGLSDQQAIEMARQRLHANPNDEKAKRVLQLHGAM